MLLVTVGSRPANTVRRSVARKMPRGEDSEVKDGRDNRLHNGEQNTECFPDYSLCYSSVSFLLPTSWYSLHLLTFSAPYCGLLIPTSFFLKSPPTQFSFSPYLSYSSTSYNDHSSFLSPLHHLLPSFLSFLPLGSFTSFYSLLCFPRVLNILRPARPYRMMYPSNSDIRPFSSGMKQIWFRGWRGERWWLEEVEAGGGARKSLYPSVESKLVVKYTQAGHWWQ